MAVAISHVTSNADDNNLTAYTFSAQSIGAAADDRDVVVALRWGSTVSANLASLSIGGEAATIDAVQNATGPIRNGMALARRRVSAGTTADIGVTLSEEGFHASIDVYRVTGAGTTLADSDGAEGTTSPQSISLDVPAGGGAIATAGVNDQGGAGTLAWTGLTEDSNRQIENANSIHSSASDEFATAQTGLAVQASATGGGTEGFGLVGISLAQLVNIVLRYNSSALRHNNLALRCKDITLRHRDPTLRHLAGIDA